jgi:hypothetical protein
VVGRFIKSIGLWVSKLCTHHLGHVRDWNQDTDKHIDDLIVYVCPCSYIYIYIYLCVYIYVCVYCLFDMVSWFLFNGFIGDNNDVNLLPFSIRVGSGFRISGFGFQISGFGFRVLGFGFRVSGFGFRVSGFGFRVSGFGSFADLSNLLLRTKQAADGTTRWQRSPRRSSPCATRSCSSGS